MSIFIKSAFYGAADEAAIDVTSAVTGLFASQQTQIFTISPATFGLSGLSAKTRYFSMTYSYSSAADATLITKSGADGAKWKIHASNPNATFNVVQAIYGTNEIFMDLTDKINLSLLESDQNCEFTVGSGDFLNRFCEGHDFASGIQKILLIRYQDQTNGPILAWCAPDFTLVNLGFGPEGSK